jgi:hypothetical protein
LIINKRIFILKFDVLSYLKAKASFFEKSKQSNSKKNRKSWGRLKLGDCNPKVNSISKSHEN